MKPSERFKAKIREVEGHWLWTGATANGVPSVWYKGKVVRARRIAWLILTGAHADEDRVVMGNCKEPLCIRHIKAVSRSGHVAYARRCQRAQYMKRKAEKGIVVYEHRNTALQVGAGD